VTGRSKRKADSANREISWKRVRAIFNNPKPPEHIWQSQFDGFDEELKRLARTPYDEIASSDLWYYHHDLAYVDLQPDLFAYLFPVCLMDWHHSLMQNVPCRHGDSEFHYGIRQGGVFEKMLTRQQRTAVAEFFRDSFLARLDVETHIFPQDHDEESAFAWLRRFNSLGIILPNIELIWNAWWSLETTGRAIAAIQYLSGLMYYRPWLWEHDGIHFSYGWLTDNVTFLETTLTVEFVHREFDHAVARLRDEPQSDEAKRAQLDLADWQERIEERIGGLPSALRDPQAEERSLW
jgi:hypothetical protein